MSRIQRLLVLALASLFVLGSIAPAIATEDHGDGDETETVEETTTTEAFEGDGPAVVIPETEPEEVEQPWTSRFIYPTIVIGTIVLIVGLAIGYNRSIRKKYNVVS